ncbi:MAG: 5-carboxymethyl-2-hydroxymuconate Delta-isomerase [Rhodobacteraceae bacterium]|nr:5-carboxymethyl-2-hydroxymuconate Delta-isomerase [Paracoccaceae bacterium]NCX07238.1 5-carboxymethyl-2-hydroxymuconate Delta-isomerase [Paracoccaceae bacterium]
MPHLMIDYSANVEPDVDIGGLCNTLRGVAASIDAFPLAGVKVRAVRVEHYAIADGNPEHGFIDISVRIREGRDMETKQNAAQKIFEAANEFVADVMQRRSLALSLELRDIDAALSPKSGSIRKYLEL